MTESMDFDDIVESSFHCEDSLLMEEDALSAAHFFSELADVSFHEGDSLIRDLQVDSLSESFIDQYDLFTMIANTTILYVNQFFVLFLVILKLKMFLVMKKHT